MNNERISTNAIADFLPSTRLGLNPAPGAASTRWQEFKQSITESLAGEFASLLDFRRVQQVVNEADALAATTQLPVLFLPALAQEKVAVVAAWQRRQHQLWRDQTTLVLAA